jgi:hypothetical protein
MFELARWAERVNQEVRTGKLKIQYTYEEFKQEVRKIPKTTDFSRLAKYAMETRLEKERTEKAKRSHVDLEDDSDSDLEMLEAPSVAHAKKQKSDPVTSTRPATSDKKEGIDYSKWSISQLQSSCSENGLTKSGAKAKLIERLNGPRPPNIWVKRKAKNEYVPATFDTGATALLVGLYLHERDAGPDAEGMTKQELYTLAESLDISKNPFSGGTTQTGPYHYDGWSNMKYLLKGDPPLVTKRKRERYKLTRSCDIAGFHLAEQMHQWCHQVGVNKCKCVELGYEYK